MEYFLIRWRERRKGTYEARVGEMEGVFAALDERIPGVPASLHAWAEYMLVQVCTPRAMQDLPTEGWCRKDAAVRRMWQRAPHVLPEAAG